MTLGAPDHGGRLGGSMTLINGAPGAARPGEDGRPSGQSAGRATPQSGIPTQGPPPVDLGPSPARPSRPFSAPLSAPPGSVPPPRPTPPPSGAPAQRSPLVVGAASRPGLDDDRTSLVDRSEPSVTDRWKKALEALRQRGPLRWGLLGALAVLQAFVLFSAVMWWLGSSTASATANVAPQTWTGVVYDVGAAGVNLRSTPQVRPDDARDTAARGARLALQCGETGDVVAKGPVTTSTWVKTADGLFVSLLYVRVPERTSIPTCSGSTADGPLMALTDPADPALPPPPGTSLGGQAGAENKVAEGSKSAHDEASQGGAPGVPTRAGGPVVLPSGGVLAPAARSGGTIPAPPTVGTGTATTTTPAPPAPTQIGSAVSPAHHKPHPPTTPNPDTTPVG
jgi:hypothetical protein